MSWLTFLLMLVFKPTSQVHRVGSPRAQKHLEYNIKNHRQKSIWVCA